MTWVLNKSTLSKETYRILHTCTKSIFLDLNVSYILNDNH